MAGRSNLQQAVPITFGFKMARLLATLQRHKQRLGEIRPRIEVFEFGGACGTLASLGDKGLEVQTETVPDWHKLTSGPILLLVHGTFSTPGAAFDGLFGSEEFKTILATFRCKNDILATRSMGWRKREPRRGCRRGPDGRGREDL
jgi:hypothetical protein